MNKTRRALMSFLLVLATGTAVLPPGTAAAAAPVAASVRQTTAGSGDTSVNGIFTGRAFDTCTAPSAAAMQQWRSSPYRAVGIYIGGVNRACAQPNLNAGWLNAVHAQGWFTLPIYVGLQAPCTRSARTFHGSVGAIANQGTAAATDAALSMGRLGLGAGNPIYLDIENYDRAARGCSGAVKIFLNAFVNGVKARGYVAGVYGGAASLTVDLVTWRTDRAFRSPDAVWFARYDGRTTTVGEPTLPSTVFSPHRRVHQYQGPHDEIYGPSKVRMNIDADAVDSYVTNARVHLTTSSIAARRAVYTSVSLVSGGTGPYTVSVTSGSLPAGLRLVGSRVVGTPTRAGSQRVQMRMSDSGSPRRAAVATLTISVS